MCVSLNDLFSSLDASSEINRDFEVFLTAHSPKSFLADKIAQLNNLIVVNESFLMTSLDWSVGSKGWAAFTLISPQMWKTFLKIFACHQATSSLFTWRLSWKRNYVGVRNSFSCFTPSRCQWELLRLVLQEFPSVGSCDDIFRNH